MVIVVQVPLLRGVGPDNRIFDTFLGQGSGVDLQPDQGEYGKDEQRQDHDVTQAPHRLH